MTTKLLNWLSATAVESKDDPRHECWRIEADLGPGTGSRVVVGLVMRDREFGYCSFAMRSGALTVSTMAGILQFMRARERRPRAGLAPLPAEIPAQPVAEDV